MCLIFNACRLQLTWNDETNKRFETTARDMTRYQLCLGMNPIPGVSREDEQMFFSIALLKLADKSLWSSVLARYKYVSLDTSHSSCKTANFSY